MIPGLYAYAATALVAGVLAFGGGWKVQSWRYGAQISTLKNQHATDIAKANQKALDDTIKMQRTKDAAIQQAEQRAAQNAAAADSARRTADGLRQQLAGVPARIASATDAAVREYAATASVVLADCIGAYQDMAAKADGHSDDARLMHDAWPK